MGSPRAIAHTHLTWDVETHFQTQIPTDCEPRAPVDLHSQAAPCPLPPPGSQGSLCCPAHPCPMLIFHVTTSKGILRVQTHVPTPTEPRQPWLG